MTITKNRKHSVDFFENKRFLRQLIKRKWYYTKDTGSLNKRDRESRTEWRKAAQLADYIS